MATRKSEWLASIKPILDRDEAKRDAKELAQELSDILSVKVDTDTDSLDDLAKEFNQQLAKMGKQQIVFSEKTLHGIVAQFANAIAEGVTKGITGIKPISADPIGKEMGDRIGQGIAGGITNGMSEGLKDAGRNLEAEFDALIQKQEKKTKELEKLQSKIRRKEDVEGKLQLAPYAKGSVQVDDHFAEYAANIIEAQDDVNDQLEQAIEDGKVTEKLLKEWVTTTQKYRDVYRTVADMDEGRAKKLLGSDYKYFTDDAYEIRTEVGFDTIAEFVDTDELLDNVDIVEKELQDLQAKLDNILQERPEFISKKEAIETAHRLQMIQQAYEKLNKTATGRKSIDKIENALSYKGAGAEVTSMPEQPTLGVYDDGYGEAQKKYKDQLKKHTETYERAKKALESAFQAYDNSAGKSWDERYRLLIKAAEEFESLENNPNLSHKDKEEALGGYRDTFETEIKPIKDIARSMLQDIINLRDGKELVTARTSSEEDDIAPNTEDVSNAQKLTEETEDKANAETRARDEAEKKKLADEASAAANHDAADEAEREQRAKEASVKAEEERQRLLKNKDAIATMHDTRGEAGAFFNSETGEFSDVIAGGDHSVETERSAWEKAAEAFDTRIHKHNYDVAAPSFSGKENDFNVWINGFDIFKKQMILANKEILSFDFSSLESVDTLKEIARKYKEAATVIDQEFDGYIKDRKVGEIFGTADNMNEQMQVRLREVLENIMAQFPGVMTSYKLPDDMVKGAETKPVVEQSVGVDRRGVEIIKNETSAHRDNAAAINEEVQAVEKLNAAKSEGSISDRYDLAPDEVKKKYREIIAIQDQVDELESKTQKTPIDIDPWNATKDQKDQIVAAWREYQKVIQEIAAMPVVETADDEKRLLELKAKAVSLYETMHQGHLNDVLGDGYAKEYGLSIEDGKQIHLDMQDMPRKDFDKSIGGLQSKLNDAYNAAQKLDQEMYVMMLRADDDSIENLYEKIRQDAMSAKPAVDAVNDVVEETRVLTQQNDSEFDDDGETIAKENGVLEDKLELLRDIAEQYGNNVTQKQRDRLEALNQKDMNEGLTPKEDERYWELSEQIDEADSALEDFEQTYDRIIIKLANGKNVEILPDDKGLRTLAKIDEEYGESYNGVEIEDVIYERIQKEAVAAEQAVDSLNDSIEETKNIAQSFGGGAGTGDASSAELEAAVTKTEALQDEVAQKDKELADKDAEIARVRAENDARLKSEADEKDRLREDLNATNQQLADAKHENELYDTALAKATEESNIKDGVIRELREQLANIKTGTGEEQASVSSEELKNVLSSIVYNVKITHDDNDKQANKIALDESGLESTLQRVFANVLNPETQQNDGESATNDAPWALEKTLSGAIQQSLTNIQNNTAKIGEKPQTVENDVDSTLGVISKTLLEINTKIVKSTKATTAEPGAESITGDLSRTEAATMKDLDRLYEKYGMLMEKAGAVDRNFAEQLYDEAEEVLNRIADIEKSMQINPETTRRLGSSISKGEHTEANKQYRSFAKKDDADEETRLKNIAKLEKEIDVLRAESDSNPNRGVRDALNAEITLREDLIELQKQGLKLEADREEYRRRILANNTKQAKKDAAQEVADIKSAFKEAEKAEKKQAASAKKEMQKQAMLGKAGNAVGRAQGVYIEAEGLNPTKLPKSFTQKGGVLDSYYSAFEKLRQKQTELSKLDVISDEQKKDLRDQINSVNQMTGEIGELVSQYQRLSGDNVKELGLNTLRPNAGLKEYEAELKRLAATSANGKLQIKSFDNETKTLTYTVKNAKREVTTYTATLRGLDNQFVAVAGSTKRSESFLEATKRKMAEISSYMSGMAVLSRATQELRRGIQYVREIDDALVELRKVTDETDESYDKFLRTAAKTGSVIGATISEVTEATATFSKLGYDMEIATEMAESAIVYKNVGDNIASAEDAADSIISTLKGFRLESSETMRIVDRFNEVGKSIAHVI